MKTTLRQLKNIIESALSETEDIEAPDAKMIDNDETEDISLGELQFDEDGINATITHVKDKEFKLSIDGKIIDDAHKLSAVISKIYSGLAKYTADNPEASPEYRKKVIAFADAGIKGGSKTLNTTSKHGLNVAWATIVDKLRKGNIRNA